MGKQLTASVTYMDKTVKRFEYGTVYEMMSELRKELNRRDDEALEAFKKETGLGYDEIRLENFRLVNHIVIDMNKITTVAELEAFSAGIQFFKNYLFNV